MSCTEPLAVFLITLRGNRSQREIAEAAWPASRALDRQSDISAYERGVRLPSPRTLAQLARVYGVSLDDLLARRNAAKEVQGLWSRMPHVASKPSATARPPAALRGTPVRPRWHFTLLPGAEVR